MAGFAPVAVSDIPNGPTRLARLAELCFSPHGGRWNVTDFERLGRDPASMLVADTRFDLGLAILRMAADEAEILNIGIVADRRRQGLGGALLSSAIRHLQPLGITRLFLEVAADNLAAQRLYMRQGFTQVGRRCGYYRGTGGRYTDAFVLEKAL